MVQKRKAVASIVSDAVKKATVAKKAKVAEREGEYVDECEDESMDESMDDAVSENPEVDEKGEEENEEDVSKEPTEKDIVASRHKELKALSAADIKELISCSGLEEGKKEDMIETLIAFEATKRAEKRAHEARIRQVVTNKKEELEKMPLSDLKKLCGGTMAKEARVEAALKQWQDEDGVDKALRKIDFDLREAKLESMDKLALRKLCTKAGIDPFLKEVMVERIVKTETVNGCFARPTVEDLDKVGEPSSKPGKTLDIVEAMLANEANRKKEQELKKKEEEKIAERMKTLKAMSVEELKKALAKKGKDNSGKKDELVETLFMIGVQEERAAEKKAKLKALSVEDLKSLASKRSLVSSSKKDTIVDDLIAHEAKMHEETRKYETRIEEAAAKKKKKELEMQTATELKDLCASKDLKAGQGKEDRIDRLVEEAKASGELDKVIAATMATVRREEILAMDKKSLLRTCDAMGVDTLNKEYMIERIMAHEF